MANRTDPLIAQVSGSDPQNLMEYITREKIYDCRFWKETCFGLSVANVLEYAALNLKIIGGAVGGGGSGPTLHFLCLTLKLLQLHPSAEDIIETFIEQEDFKYVRALGALYVRLTGRPVDIYKALEPLYTDWRKLRFYQHQQWSIVHMDEYIHNLLTETHVVGITLPRLIARNVLEEAGYIDNEADAVMNDDDDDNEGNINSDLPPPYILPRRPTALKDVLLQYGGPLAYLKHKALVEKCPEAIAAWKDRPEAAIGSQQAAGETMEQCKEQTGGDNDDGERKIRRRRSNDNDNDEKKKPKKKTRNYENLFKTSKSNNTSTAKQPSSSSTAAEPTEDGQVMAEEGSAEYWNEQRAKLGLKPLKE